MQRLSVVVVMEGILCERLHAFLRSIIIRHVGMSHRGGSLFAIKPTPFLPKKKMWWARGRSGWEIRVKKKVITHRWFFIFFAPPPLITLGGHAPLCPSCQDIKYASRVQTKSSQVFRCIMYHIWGLFNRLQIVPWQKKILTCICEGMSSFWSTSIFTQQQHQQTKQTCSSGSK